MNAPKNPDDLLGMSDEDFSNLNAPPEAEAEQPGAEGAEQDGGAQAQENESGTAAESEQADADNAGDKGEKSEGEQDGDGEANGGEADDEGGEAAKSEGEAEKAAGGKPEAEAKKAEGEEKKADEKSETPLTEADYKGFYESMMSFRANGKDIVLKSPEEAKTLIQMGANYTRKMQAIKPHQKVLMMLEKNGLLDEGKLSFLIDIEKKNPEAIKKLVKDSGIDPLDIDTAEDGAYQPGDHSVSDSEVDFKAMAEEVAASSPTGKETLTEIVQHWDDASKGALWETPSLLREIDQQRGTGVYDLITTEIDRRKTLGIISPNTPFLEAYTLVGDDLVAEEAAKAKAQPNVVQSDRQPIATTAGKPKAVVKDGDKAAAASPTRSGPKVAKEFVNPLEMSDEDFLKQMEGRL